MANENLESIIKFIEEKQANMRPYVKEWKIKRPQTIKVLNELREKLDNVHVGTNYGKAAGNFAAIVGAVGSLIGFLPFLENTKRETLVNIGNLLHHAGVFVDGVSNGIEFIISEKYLSEIEAKLKEDKELSQHLGRNLPFSSKLDTEVQKLFGVSIASKKIGIIVKVFLELAKLSKHTKSFDAAVSLMRQGKYSAYIGNDIKLDKLQQLFDYMSARPQNGKRIHFMLSCLSQCITGLQMLRNGNEIYEQIMGTCIVPTLRCGLNSENTTFCCFKGIDLALSVLSFCNAKSIIQDGKSKYSDALKELTSQLEKELKAMESFEI